MVAEGLRNKAVADRLSISEGTVRSISAFTRSLAWMAGGARPAVQRKGLV